MIFWNRLRRKPQGIQYKRGKRAWEKVSKLEVINMTVERVIIPGHRRLIVAAVGTCQHLSTVNICWRIRRCSR